MVFSPYHTDIQAEKPKFELTVIEDGTQSVKNNDISTNKDKGVLLKGNLEKARGEKVRNDFSIKVGKEKNENVTSVAVAYPVGDLKGNKYKETKEKIKKHKKNKQAVYLYGGINAEEINNIFDEEIVPVLNQEELRSELVEKGLKEEEIVTALQEHEQVNNEKFDVVGVYEVNGQVVPYLATIDSDVPLTSVHYVDSIYEHAEESVVPLNSLLSQNKAEAVAVRSVTNRNSSAYSGTTKIANINVDMYLDKKGDADSKYDYFTLKNHTEVDAYNGAKPFTIGIRHTIPYTADEIEDWRPKSTTNQDNFNVSLPWGFSWQFQTQDDVDVTTTGSQVNDYANWHVSEARTFSSYLHDPERFTPGHSWLSTGTYANTRIATEFAFDYKYETRKLAFNYHFTYDY